MTWIKIAKTDDIKINSGKEFDINGLKIAIFNVNGVYHALEALCRHQDGSLAPGKIQGEIVECPLHSWHYNIRTGKLLDYLQGVELKKYKVEKRGDELLLDA
jgi:3-phenylpropionate/trans-cinnamate dioxygenase ferredoxin component